MQETPSKPLPQPTPTTQPFWDALDEGRLILQYSPSAREWVFYPRVLAPCTLADDLEWREASGLGTLYTYTVARYPTAPPWRDECPQLLAVVELDEGPRLTTEMIDVAPQELRVGMRVEAVFSRDNDASPVLLRFKPAAAATPASSAGQEG